MNLLIGVRIPTVQLIGGTVRKYRWLIKGRNLLGVTVYLTRDDSDVADKSTWSPYPQRAYLFELRKHAAVYAKYGEIEKVKL